MGKGRGQEEETGDLGLTSVKSSAAQLRSGYHRREAALPAVGTPRPPLPTEGSWTGRASGWPFPVLSTQG